MFFFQTVLTNICLHFCTLPLSQLVSFRHLFSLRNDCQLVATFLAPKIRIHYLHICLEQLKNIGIKNQISNIEDSLRTNYLLITSVTLSNHLEILYVLKIAETYLFSQNRSLILYILCISGANFSTTLASLFTIWPS